MSIDLISAANTAYTPGTILGQIVLFENSAPYDPYGARKRVDKVSLNLSVNTTGRKDYVEESGGLAAFQAANFQESRDGWVFQPTINWQPGNNWESSGTPIVNSFQSQYYIGWDDSVISAPFLKYEILFSTVGNYDIWGYGKTSGGNVYWSFQDNMSDIYDFTLGEISDNRPRWTKIGSVSIEEGGVYTFTVYLSEASFVLLDQWCFVNSILGNIFVGNNVPVTNSVGPFNTVVRVRSLSSDSSVDSIDFPTSIGPKSISSWLPSKNIIASGKHNYAIKGISDTYFISGLTIEYWQIGGSENHFAAWRYSFPATSVGKSFISNDLGQNYRYE